jgi:hypothetical protein
MGLRSYGLAVGLGYVLGRPGGRASLAQLGRQAAALIRRPEIVALHERGKALAAEQVQTVKQKITARSQRADRTSGPDDPGPATARSRCGLRTRVWRPRFSRSRNAHFPSSADIAPVDSASADVLGGTTVMEDSEAARLGMPVTPRPETSAPPTMRP